MKNTKRFILGFLTATLAVGSALADNGQIRIPLKTFLKPAADLVDEKGNALLFAELAGKHVNGYDLSKLLPIANKYGQDQSYPAVDTELYKKMPNAEAGVRIDSIVGSNRELGLYTVIIKPDQAPSERYMLSLGLTVHTSLMRAALLRKLGYYQESPKYYPKIKMNFESTAAKENFVNTAFCDKGIDESSIDCLSLQPLKSKESPREFISHISDTSLYVHGAYLEKMNSEVPSLFDGLTPATGNTANYLSQSRAFRGLAAPFVIADLGESVMSASTQSVTVRDGIAIMNFAKDFYFPQTNYDDMRWVLRRLAKLTETDWDEIVAAGQYPPALNQRVKALLMLRTDDLLKTFFEEKMFNLKIPAIRYSSDDGYMKDGRLTTENIPNYPPRFSHGERQSPFESGDLLKYMKMRLQSAAIGVATVRLNEALTKTLAKSSKTEGYQLGSRGVEPIGYESGVEGGIGFSAARIVTTGTFYGSQAPIQLVDNVSITAGMGYTRIMKDFGTSVDFLGGNIGYTREFTHVRPVSSMNEAKTISWKDLYVPSKLKSLASPLKDGKLSEFVAALQVGEVFTITESVGAKGRVGREWGLDALLGITGSIQPTVGISAGAGKVILRQTQITRTDAGFQIFVRKQDSRMYDVALDVNYLINLLKIKHEVNKTKIHTDVFVLNFNGAFVSKVEKGEIDISGDEVELRNFEQQKDFGNKVAGALRGIIYQNSTDKLYSPNFSKQRFEADHGIKTTVNSAKLLVMREADMEEDKILKFKKTEVNAPEGSTVENSPIEIAIYRKGELTGQDRLGFGLELLDGVLANKLKKNAPALSQDSQNPSQMPYGKAEWRMVRADTELTQNREGALPSVAIIQYVWGGWSMSRSDLEQILAQIQNRVRGTNIDGRRIIPAEVFNQTKKLDFFRVTANLSLLPGALEKIKALVVAPEVSGDEKVEKAKYVGRFFQKISERLGKVRVEDKIIYDNIIKIIGDGDETRGRAIYMNQCQTNKGANYQYTWSRGTGYECLEPWIEKIIKASRKFQSADLRQKNRMMAELLFILDERIPLSQILTAIGEDNYIFFADVSGFRVGDANGDIGYWISPSLGEPKVKHPYSNGLISAINDKENGQGQHVLSIELERSNLPAQ